MIFDPRPVSARLVPPLQIPAGASLYTQALLARMQQADLAVAAHRTSTTDRLFLRVVDQVTGQVLIGDPSHDVNGAVEAWMDEYGALYFTGEEPTAVGLTMRGYLMNAAEGADPEYAYHPVNLRESYDEYGVAFGAE
jgi:hypothetical protein